MSSLSRIQDSILATSLLNSRIPRASSRPKKGHRKVGTFLPPVGLQNINSRYYALGNPWIWAEVEFIHVVLMSKQILNTIEAES